MAYHAEGGCHDEREHYAAGLEEGEAREKFPQPYKFTESSYGPEEENGQAAFLYARLRPVVVCVVLLLSLKYEIETVTFCGVAFVVCSGPAAKVLYVLCNAHRVSIS